MFRPLEGQEAAGERQRLGERLPRALWNDLLGHGVQGSGGMGLRKALQQQIQPHCSVTALWPQFPSVTKEQLSYMLDGGEAGSPVSIDALMCIQ